MGQFRVKSQRRSIELLDSSTLEEKSDEAKKMEVVVLIVRLPPKNLIAFLYKN